VRRFRLVLDPTACDAQGLCAQLFPEGIGLDDWGFPIVRATVPDDEVTHARRAVSACPALALRLVRCREQPGPGRVAWRLQGSGP
jgi:ferredoxin